MPASFGPFAFYILYRGNRRSVLYKLLIPGIVGRQVCDLAGIPSDSGQTLVYCVGRFAFRFKRRRVFFDKAFYNGLSLRQASNLSRFDLYWRFVCFEISRGSSLNNLPMVSRWAVSSKMVSAFMVSPVGSRRASWQTYLL